MKLRSLELNWLKTRKPLKRFLRISPRCHPKLKLEKNESFARATQRPFSELENNWQSEIGNVVIDSSLRLA